MKSDNAALITFLGQKPDEGTESNYQITHEDGSEENVQLIRTTTFNNQSSNRGTPLQASILNNNNQYILNSIPETLIYTAPPSNENWNGKTFEQWLLSLDNFPQGFDFNSHFRVELLAWKLDDAVLTLAHPKLILDIHNKNIYQTEGIFCSTETDHVHILQLYFADRADKGSNKGHYLQRTTDNIGQQNGMASVLSLWPNGCNTYLLPTTFSLIRVVALQTVVQTKSKKYLIK